MSKEVNVAQDYSININDYNPNAFCLIRLETDDEGSPVDWTFLYCNEALAKLEGKTREELVGHRFFDVFPHRSRRLLNYYYKAAFEGQPVSFDEISDEIGLYLHIDVYPVGQPGICTCTLYDIEKETNEKRYKREQAEASQGMVAALTAGYLNVYVVNPETNRGTILKLDGYVIDGIKETSKDFVYSQMLSTYANARVYDGDRENFLKVVMPEALVHSFADGREKVEISYRVPINGKLEHYSGLYIRVSKPTEELKLIAGFRNTEDVISVQKKTRDEGLYSAYAAVSDLYLAMFRANLKRNTYSSIKTTDAIMKCMLPGNDKFDDNINAIITELAKPESVSPVLDFLNRNTITQRMQGKKHIATYFEGKIAGSCRLHLIKEDENQDGTLQHVILAVEVLENDKRQLKAALEQGEFKTKIISSIAAAYKEIIVLNFERRDYYVVSGQKGGYKTTGIRGSFEQLKEKMFHINLVDEDKMDSEIKSFFDFDTLQERLEARDVTSLEVKSISGCWYLASFVANERDEDGRVIDVLFIIRDIEEQKAIEHKKDAALLEQLAIIDTLSKSFRNVFVANMNDGTARVIRLADNYNVRAIRDVSGQVFAFDTVVERWLKENVHPEDKERLAETLNIDNLRQIFAKQDALVGTYRNIEDNVQHYYQYDFRRIGDTDNVVAGFQIIDKIIEEHQAQENKKRELEEAKLREEKEHAEVISSLSTLYSTIFRADIDTHEYDILISIPLMSKVAKASGNFDDVKETVIESFMEPEFRDSMSAFLDFDTLAERLRYVNSITVDYKAPTGRWMQARFIVKRRDENNVAKEVLYVARDITEEKHRDLKQQEALKNALAAAQQANKAKSTFLSSMSHDIRTPMNAIIGFTALAQTHIDNQVQVQDYLAKINTSSSHLLSLINDILDMSRIDSGTVKLDEKPVHIPDILHDLRTIIQGLVNSKNLNLYIDTQDVVNEDVISDRLRLNQVLLNIVSNAIKFTQPGGDIIIHLVEKPCSMKNYTSYELSVKDTGIGISEDFLEHVFDTFSREQSTTVSGIQGTGLGLAITKNIVEMMGGEIRVESEEGKGSIFTVTLNLRLANAPVKNELIPALLGARALVVDDDMNTCRSVSKMLRDIKMRPDWTVSGKEAIVRAQDAADMKDEYKVYIIDYLMPDMNGIETARRIRKVICDDVPIIALTAYDWSDFEYEAREAGVTAFVSKPIFMSELRNVLTQPTISETIIKENKEEVYDYSGKRILLVEDNELNREIATSLLEETGIAVDSVSDGDVAVTAINEAPIGKYDLVLMDIQMPKMDGYTATREIRTLPDSQKANIPIVAMTANAFEEDKQRALNSGMNGHIIKPISIEAINNVLDEIFDQRSNC